MPSPSDAEELNARILRMQHLIDELERTCSESRETRDAFARLRSEMEAASRLWKTPR